MNVRFLKEISDAYCIDNDVNKSADEIFNEFYDVIKEVRTQEPYFYNYLCEMSPVEQQKVFKWYTFYGLTENDEEVLAEFVMSVLSILDPWLSKIRGAVSKRLAQIATRIERYAENTARRSRSFRLRHAIVQKNFEECYKRCNVDVEDLPSHIYTTVKGRSGSTFGTGYIPEVAVRKGVCLKECYIKKVIGIIGNLSEMLFDCLKSSGELQQYKNVEPDDILSIIGTTKIGTACQEHQKKLDDMLKEFKALMDFGYAEEGDEDKKQLMYNELRASIIRARDRSSSERPGGYQRRRF